MSPCDNVACTDGNFLLRFAMIFLKHMTYREREKKKKVEENVSVNNNFRSTSAGFLWSL